MALPIWGLAQKYHSHQTDDQQLKIRLEQGELLVTPLTEKSVRIQWLRDGLKEEQNLVLVNNLPSPKFTVTEDQQHLYLKTNTIGLKIAKSNASITYTDASGKVFLKEKDNSKTMMADTIAGKDCFIAEQSFDSPEDEYLFGLGQFQDGHYNLKNITRKLIQVNSQIAIPFLYSSKGYGILWHQYGLTYFNPTDEKVVLEKAPTMSIDSIPVEVTTTSGTRRVSQRQAYFKGQFSVPEDGEYTLMMDMGDMESQHLLTIDGKNVIDQTNLWLPPAVSKIVELKKGQHEVEIVCKATNTPQLSWRKTNDATTFRSPHAKSLDYIVFYGDKTDDVIRDYRNLTGEVPMLPIWAFGFWQCRERYTSGDHLVKTVEEFRKRNLPVDVIVQDWQYWGKYGWGVPKFDESNYPEPAKFIKKLHDLKTHFSISVWENLDKKSEIAQAYLDKNLYIENSPWIDIYNPETQKTHWNALNTNLFQLGVDSWWMDATEPENDALVGKTTYFGPGEFYRLTYPLLVSKAVYDGQRATDPSKRVTILTRSAFPGQQRFGTINWSGDIGWNWDTYRRQIVAGLNYNLTGMPYWTTDIGGFFRPRNDQYNDKAYHEILTRWFQWACFNPVFRMHGYQTETEPWKYGEEVESNMRKMMNVRYRLMPYIYAEAWQVSEHSSTMMRPLVMDFNKDPKAVAQPFEYMFGSAFLVAPMTESGVSRSVYLPKGADWFDFWTGKAHKGGQEILANAPRDQIPVFVKSGSIVPMTKLMQNTGDYKCDTLEIRIYPGANGEFELYEDEGDNYNYEQGKYNTIKFSWNDRKKVLSIGPSKGSFNNMKKDKIFRVLKVSDQKGRGIEDATDVKEIRYNGSSKSLKMR